MLAIIVRYYCIIIYYNTEKYSDNKFDCGIMYVFEFHRFVNF